VKEIEKVFLKLNGPNYGLIKGRLVELMDCLNGLIKEVQEKGVKWVEKKYTHTLITAGIGHRIIVFPIFWTANQGL